MQLRHLRHDFDSHGVEASRRTMKGNQSLAEFRRFSDKHRVRKPHFRGEAKFAVSEREGKNVRSRQTLVPVTGIKFQKRVGADGGGRTNTLVRVPDFESSASANSATSATKAAQYKSSGRDVNKFVSGSAPEWARD